MEVEGVAWFSSAFLEKYEGKHRLREELLNKKELRLDDLVNSQTVIFGNSVSRGIKFSKMLCVYRVCHENSHH